MALNDLQLLVGTTKGAFLISGTGDRGDWKINGPLCDGWPINHVIGESGLRECGWWGRWWVATCDGAASGGSSDGG